MPGEVVVVTGASRGIGRATALACAERGATLALLGRPSVALSSARDACRALGAKADVFACDVAIEEDVARAAAQLLEAFGAPAAVVNNAGIVVRGPLVHEAAVSDWDRVLAVNLRGPFLVSRALLPAMLATHRGRFVHVSSISATLGSPGAASYAASKWGLVGFSKSLAEELRGTGLVSVALLPGSVDTDMLAGSGFTPAMTAEDVARTAVHLAFDAAPAVNGSAVEMFG